MLADNNAMSRKLCFALYCTDHSEVWDIMPLYLVIRLPTFPFNRNTLLMAMQWYYSRSTLLKRPSACINNCIYDMKISQEDVIIFLRYFHVIMPRLSSTCWQLIIVWMQTITIVSRLWQLKSIDKKNGFLFFKQILIIP